MENKINLSGAVNPYLQHFQLAQYNFNKLVEEERIYKRVQRSKRRFSKAYAPS